MLAHLRRSLVLAVLCLVVFGFVYAFAGTGLSQLLFKSQAERLDDHERLAAHRPELVQPQVVPRSSRRHRVPTRATRRPTPAAATTRWSPTAAPASLRPPSSARAPRCSWPTRRPSSPTGTSSESNPTVDLVTTSGSGFDPDITPADALVQIPMVAKATGVSPAQLKALITRETHPAQWGFLGSSYIDVLQLNEGLAKLEG